MNRLATLLLASALLAPAAAQADGLYVRTVCLTRHYCTTIVGRPGNGMARIVAVPQDLEPARTPEQQAEHDYVFELTCSPKIVVDNLGVSRYTYKHAGCDTGRIPNN